MFFDSPQERSIELHLGVIFDLFKFRPIFVDHPHEELIRPIFVDGDEIFIPLIKQHNKGKVDIIAIHE